MIVDDGNAPRLRAVGDGERRVYPLLLGQDVSNLEFHPAYHHRAMGSPLWSTSTGDEFKATVALVYASIATQDPGGTLPMAEAELAHHALCGLDMGLWQRVRSFALRGWEPVQILNADGAAVSVRYAHAEVEAIAVGMWQLKVTAKAKAASRRVSQQCARVRDQLRRLGQEHVAESEATVDRIRDWLDERDLIISRENVRDAAWRLEGGKLL